MKTLLLLKETGLALNHGLALGVIHKHPGSRVCEVAAKLGWSETMTSQLLILLQKRKYLRSEYQEATGRTRPHRHYFLQPKAKAITSQFTYETPIPH